MSTLALFGGSPVLSKPLSPYNTIGEAEAEAVSRVMRSGKISAFIGAWCDDFNGGPEIKAFETAWSRRFGCKHAVSVNSNTSGLIAALGAIRISPGDEVIVPPMTMSATAIAPLFYGAIPVFVDVEPHYFCLDLAKVIAAITPRTRAILAVNLFGHPAALASLRKLADEKGIYLIEDAAQSPLAQENDRFAGTIGHIGVFSLNYHKHIHTGEGGMCCTDDDDLALRLRAIRNHGENIVEALDISDSTNLIGFNFRMTELSAAIGLEQLKKMDALVAEREMIATRLSQAVRQLPGLIPPQVSPECRHVYYVWAARYEQEVTGVSRSLIAKALNAEGVPVWEGYIKPLYLLPVFLRRIAIGNQGWPFTLTERRYEKGMCPVAENLFEQSLLEFCICSYAMSELEQDSVIEAFYKVFASLPALAKYEMGFA